MVPQILPRLLLLIVASFALGCAPVPKGRYTMDSIHMSGDHALDDDEIEAVMASRPSSKFLGLFEGVIYEYEVFDRFVLERDLQRIERYYRARGYYEARARAARVVYKGRGAKVQIEIEEGLPVTLERVDVHGLETLPREMQDELKRDAFSELGGGGEPFEENKFEDAESFLKSKLEDQGYAYLRLKRAANVDLPQHRASAGFWVTLGPKCTYGSVKLEGLGDFPEAPVRRAINLKEGDPYSRSELDEAKRALLDLNVFSSVAIDPDEPSAQNAERDAGSGALQVPIRVKVERAKLRGVHLGVGMRIDTQRTDVHLVAGWEHNNFFGGFRRFLVEVTPGFVLFPTRLPDLQKPELLLPTVRVRSEFRQPGFLEARTNALVRGEVAIAPVSYGSKYDPAATVLGYQDLRGATGLERSLWRLYGVVTENVQFSNPFSYRGELPAGLGPALIAYPELFLALDLRNDRIWPHNGAYFSLDTQVASLFGDARDLKVQPEARFYVPVGRKITFATRATFGFLFPRNYGQTLVPNIKGETPPDLGTWNQDSQLIFMRGFFSGGSGSNRGYGFRDIGPHGRVPYLYNTSQNQSERPECLAASPPPDCVYPLGGFSLWELSAELRFPLTGPLSAATFADASDVSAYEGDLRFSRPHLSAGLGIRLDTPIGPVRLDVGYRLPGLQTLGANNTEGENPEPPEIFGAPFAASFGIGQVY